MHAGGHAKALVKRILAFSRSGVGERGPINVQAVIEETLELLAASLAPGVRLEKRLEAGDAAIIGDATQLHQVAMNLCTNALQAMENGGVLEVALDRADVAQSRRLWHGELAPGAYVRLCVGDTGSGIPPHVLDRMFDPFFTTKGVGEGTGLGLSLVHGIVADLGGAIDVRATVGRARFHDLVTDCQRSCRPFSRSRQELPRGGVNGDDRRRRETAGGARRILAELGCEPVGFSSTRRRWRHSAQRRGATISSDRRDKCDLSAPISPARFACAPKSDRADEPRARRYVIAGVRACRHPRSPA
jgi:hypothetical protein